MKYTLTAAALLLCLALGTGIGFYMGKNQSAEYTAADEGTPDPEQGPGPAHKHPEHSGRRIPDKKRAKQLPMDIAPLKALAAKQDPESVQKAVALHRAEELSSRIVIEMQARSNPRLKAALAEKIKQDLASDDSGKQARAVRSAVRLKLFDDTFTSKIRPLLKHSNFNVRLQALSFCGWAQDRDAFPDVFTILKTSDSEKLLVNAFNCMAVIGKTKGRKLAPVCAEKLTSGSRSVRRACLSSLFHIKGSLNSSEVRTRVRVLSETDPYCIERDREGDNRYPLRELAKELLKLHGQEGGATLVH